MRRKLDTGLVLSLFLVGWCALVGAPVAFAESRGAGLKSNSNRPPAQVSFVALTQNGHERRGNHFPADQVRVLKIDVEWLTLAGAHTQRLDLITPDGAVYQRFTAAVEGVVGHATVETLVPVAGSWITQYSLEGTWKVNVYLDDAIKPLATATFTLVK